LAKTAETFFGCSVFLSWDKSLVLKLYFKLADPFAYVIFDWRSEQLTAADLTGK